MVSETRNIVFMGQIWFYWLSLGKGTKRKIDLKPDCVTRRDEWVTGWVLRMDDKQGRLVWKELAGLIGAGRSLSPVLSSIVI